ncbi:MAG: hypothetical protein MUO40_00170, partial [Anaerolineaceae bacterium]|nr:hypothetical protein [Anaerolineaceae bacterium]
SDPAGGFFDTTSEAEKVLIRPKELKDNATPSGNALAAEALLKMATFLENEAWRLKAEKSLSLVVGLVADYPTGFGRWLGAAAFNLGKTRQIVIVGDLSNEDTRTFLHEINKTYRPNTIVAASSLPVKNGTPELLADRLMIDGKTTIYVCEGFVCKQPVSTLENLKIQLGA